MFYVGSTLALNPVTDVISNHKVNVSVTLALYTGYTQSGCVMTPFSSASILLSADILIFFK